MQCHLAAEEHNRNNQLADCDMLYNVLSEQLLSVPVQICLILSHNYSTDIIILST